MIILMLVLIYLFSFFMTAWLRRYAIRKNILDIPNQRSSHVIPTPRGGGVAIVVSFACALIFLAYKKTIAVNVLCALLGGGLGIAAIGYADDLYKLPTLWRFLGHIMVAAWAVYWLNGFSNLALGAWRFSLPHAGFYVAVFAIVWCTNLYNFMDGIDGLAGSEGLFVALAASAALWVTGESNTAIMLLFLAASIAGFTYFNWPPAKIFMGDAGSGFLGYIFSVLALHTANTGKLPIIFWFIVLGIFICDATFTLLYRMLQGKKWYAAHREHAYQQLISRGASHSQVTLSILTMNVLLVSPLAFFTLFQPGRGFWLMTGLLLILFLIWFSIKIVKHKDAAI
jgi:Fuc2NAc and GlcNAc transferase